MPAYLKHFLCNCTGMDINNLIVNNGSGDDLVPSGNKPLLAIDGQGEGYTKPWTNMATCQHALVKLVPISVIGSYVIPMEITPRLDC